MSIVTFKQQKKFIEDEKVFASAQDLKKSAENGDVQAIELTGLLTELNLIDSDGKGFCKREDQRKTREVYKKAADKGSPTAKLLRDGDDLLASEEYFNQALEQGYENYQKIGASIKARTGQVDRLSRFKILVIEDSAAERDVLCTIIRTRGFPVLEAKHGGEALSLLRENDGVCLIITDVLMPVLGGIDFIKKIKANEKYKSIPIIISSASADKKHVVAARSLGISGWLVKPIGPAKIDKILDFFKAAA